MVVRDTSKACAYIECLQPNQFHLMTHSKSTFLLSYDAHLPTKLVKLPLQYSLSARRSSAQRDFRDDLFCKTHILDLTPHANLAIDAVSFGITNDLHTLKVAPLYFKTTLESSDFQELSFDFPHPIVNPNSLAIQLVQRNLADPYILVDLIDDSFLVISIKIELDDLNSSQEHPLLLEEHEEWTCISMPYSFELRSKPILMFSLNEQDIIVCLQDGDVLHFRRQEPLASFDIFSFVESPSQSTLWGLITGFLLGKSGNEGLCLKSVVDLCFLTSETFATLLAEGVLTVWSLNSHTAVSSLNLNLTSPLTLTQTKFLQFHEQEERKEIHILLPNYQLQTSHKFITAFINSKGDLIEADSNIIDLCVSASDATEQHQHPQVRDFIYLRNTKKLLVLAKVFVGAILVTYHGSDREPFSEKDIVQLTPEEQFESMVSLPEKSLSLLVLDSGTYDTTIVSAAIKMILQSRNLESDPRHLIRKFSEENSVDEETLWRKVLVLSEEIQKLSLDPRGIDIVGGKLLISASRAVGLLRSAHRFEIYCDSECPLSSALKMIRQKLSLSYQKSLHAHLADMSNFSIETVSEFASRTIGTRLKEFEIVQITSLVEHSQNPLAQIKDLISGSVAQVDDPNTKLSIGPFMKGIACASFETILRTHESLVLNLLSLVLCFELNAELTDLLTILVRQLSNIEILAIMMSIKSPKSSLLRISDQSRDDSLFWCLISAKSSQVQIHLSLFQFTEAYSVIEHLIVLDQLKDYFVDACIDLLSIDISSEKMSTILDRLGTSNPLSPFLRGILCFLRGDPDGFAHHFNQVTTLSLSGHSLAKLRTASSGHENVVDFLDSLFSERSGNVNSMANLYHQLSLLCNLFDRGGRKLLKDLAELRDILRFAECALGFSFKAVSVLEDSRSEWSESDKVFFVEACSLYVKNCLYLEDYSNASQAIGRLVEFLSRTALKALLTTLIRHLLAKKRTNLLISNDLLILQEHWLLVDEILLCLANENLLLSSALKSYELVFAWRLLGAKKDSGTRRLVDKRGAAQSLYYFITRFKSEQEFLKLSDTNHEDYRRFKLKVLELYMIVINTLRTFKSADEQWIIKRDISKGNTTITLSDIVTEYSDWLDDLQADLGNGSYF